MSQLYVHQRSQFFCLPCRKAPHVKLPNSVHHPGHWKNNRAKNAENTDSLRQSAHHKMNSRGSYFVKSLQSHYQGNTYLEQVEKLKERVKEMLDDDKESTRSKIELIDNLERLGIGYHFEEEIKKTLELAFISQDTYTKENLHYTATYFRILRQHGYKAPQDLFNKFMDETGHFRLDLCGDVKGILGLYEASHLCLEGEHILHEAREFTSKHLKLLQENINQKLGKEVRRSLEVPLHWRMPRSEARYYIDSYQTNDKMNPALLELAILDFNLLQATYQEELFNLSRWWKELGLTSELSFVRDSLVEGFLGSVGVVYKPQYECCREWITKIVCVLVAMDDIYDTYGSLDELEAFTAAVERWDLTGMEQLPDYMRICFLALFNTTNDIVYIKFKTQRLDILSHLKQVWAEFCNAMLLEAKWSKMGSTPSLKDYLENAWISSSTKVGLVVAFFGTNPVVTDDVLEELKNKTDLIYYSAMILRLCNDLATSSAELERGDVASSIQCYMHESNCTEQIARKRIEDLISVMWMKLNKSVFDSPFEDSFIDIVVNNARTAHSIYQHGDGFSAENQEAKKRAIELLVKPIDCEDTQLYLM